MIVLGKKYLNDPREAAIKGCTQCCCLAHDFTKPCAVTHNKQTQLNAFGVVGAAKVGIEGYTVVHHTDEQYDELQLDFHSFLSDSNIQEARAVFFHLKQLIIDLRRKDKLKPGSRVLCITDGCAKVSKKKKKIATITNHSSLHSHNHFILSAISLCNSNLFHVVSIIDV